MKKLEEKKKILVTGCCGFIGMHLCEDLLNSGYDVYGIDIINDYYDVKLKLDRKKYLENFNNFYFEKLDISNFEKLKKYFIKNTPSKVVNLAAQAGVRYSLENPHAYIKSNIVGFMNILECCKDFNIEGLIYASSSSVYGANKILPFSEQQTIDNPISIYAATKTSNELMAKTYYNLYNLKSTGLRFFTVYGEWGRPDMAYYIFANKICNDEKIKIYNYGEMHRDFTYIDDILSGINSAIENNYNCEIFNLGNSKTVSIMRMVEIIENKMNKKAFIDLQPILPGEIEKTNADIAKAKDMLGFEPKINIDFGLLKFLDWYIDYYNLK